MKAYIDAFLNSQANSISPILALKENKLYVGIWNSIILNKLAKDSSKNSNPRTQSRFHRRPSARAICTLGEPSSPDGDAARWRSLSLGLTRQLLKMYCLVYLRLMHFLGTNAGKSSLG
jgi:hypothetical protein